jgi:hypothetical protein
LPEETREERVALIPFCPACLGSGDDSSWGELISEGYCCNCGNASTIMIPRWAVKSIRQQASWVGKRYYPHEEDFEQHAELEALRALAPDDPERTVKPVEDQPGRFETKQPTEKGSLSTWVNAGSLDEAKLKAKVVLPFRPEWVPTAWNRVDQGGLAIPAHPGRVLTIHKMLSPFYEGTKYAVRNAMNRVLTTSGTWVEEPLGSMRDADFYKKCRFPDFMSAVRAAEKARA